MNYAIIIGIVGIVAVVLAIFFIKKMFWFLFNSIIGLFALMGWNVLFTPVKINFFSVVLVAVGGIFGLAAVVILHFLHLWF